MQLLNSDHVRERDKALLRSILVGGVWNGFLLSQVRGQDVPCRFCGAPDNDGHLFFGIVLFHLLLRSVNILSSMILWRWIRHLGLGAFFGMVGYTLFLVSWSSLGSSKVGLLTTLVVTGPRGLAESIVLFLVLSKLYRELRSGVLSLLCRPLMAFTLELNFLGCGTLALALLSFQRMGPILTYSEDVETSGSGHGSDYPG